MSIKRKWLAASLVAALGAAGATVVQFNGASPIVAALSAAGAIIGQADDGSTAAASGGGGTGAASASPLSGSDDSTLATLTEKYIVVFDEAPLASYRGEIRGLPAPKSLQGARNSARIDVHSDEAKQYVNYLQREQTMDIADLSQEIRRPLRVQRRMQHAINAIVTELTEAEAALLAKQPGVSLVEAYQEFEIETDVGPRLIGAETIWTGATPGEPGRFQGEGMVVGIIDTGINFGSPFVRRNRSGRWLPAPQQAGCRQLPRYLPPRPGGRRPL